MPSERSRRKSRWQRAAYVCIAAAIVVSATIFAVAWYATNRLIAVTHVHETYPLQVLAINQSARTIAITPGPDANEPGIFRLSWPSGYARVGRIIIADSRRVIRQLLSVSGRLTVGAHVGIQVNPYFGDPRSALGVAFTNVSIPTQLGGAPAWWIPAHRATWVILVHGFGGSRADTLPALRIVHALGYPALAITYRNDAGAPASPDHHTHLGGTEWRDVEAAVRYALQHGATGVVLFGYSLGGAMALVVAHESALRRDIRLLILDSPLLDWRATLEFGAARRDLPQISASIIEKLLAWRIHLNFGQFDQLRRERTLEVPVLLIQGAADTLVPSAEADRFAQARPHLVTYLRVPGAEHVSAIDTDPTGYRVAVQRAMANIR